MLPYIATYLLIAAILATADHFSHRPLFIRTQMKHLPWKLNYSFRWWSVQEYWAALTMASILGLYLLGFWHITGGKLNRDIGQALFIPIALGSSVLTIRQFKLVEKFKAHAWWLTSIAALLAIGLGIYASAYADSFILGLTRVDAAQFPLAQKAVTTLMVISIWLFLGTLLISAIVLIGYLVIAVTTPTFIGLIKRDPIKVMAWRKYKPGSKEHRRNVMLLVIFAGSFTSISIAMSFVDYIARHANDAIQETLVFASFHLHPKDCGIPGWSHDAWVALVSEGRAVLAAPAKRGYTFQTVKCEMQSKSALNHQHSEMIKKDNYY
jgi:hypothetical protein